MEIKALIPGDPLWETVAGFAENCIWPAGRDLADRMRKNDFRDWERVFVALDDGKIAGFCTLSKTDRLPKAPYTPYVGFIFVDLPYRGNRLSSDLIDAASGAARAAGFDRVFIVSDHVGLYEKYGFTAIDQQSAPWNRLKTVRIFMREMDAAPESQQNVGARSLFHLGLYIVLLIGAWVIISKIAFPG